MRFLYLQQKDLDVNLKKVMRYQKVQKITSLFNAVLACVPFVGAVSAHWIGAGATVMTEVAGEGFGVSGIVESVFGIGKDLSSFVTEPAVDRFWKRPRRCWRMKDGRIYPNKTDSP